LMEWRISETLVFNSTLTGLVARENSSMPPVHLSLLEISEGHKVRLEYTVVKIQCFSLYIIHCLKAKDVGSFGSSIDIHLHIEGRDLRRVTIKDISPESKNTKSQLPAYEHTSAFCAL
jgi:hypothetical protein